MDAQIISDSFKRHLWLAVLAVGIMASIGAYKWTNRLNNAAIQREITHRSQVKLQSIRTTFEHYLDSTMAIVTVIENKLATHQYLEEEEMQGIERSLLARYSGALAAISIMPPEGMGQIESLGVDGSRQLEPPPDTAYLHGLTPGALNLRLIRARVHQTLRLGIAIGNQAGGGYLITDWNTTYLVQQAIANTPPSGLDVETGAILNGRFILLHSHRSRTRKPGEKKITAVAWRGGFSINNVGFEVRTHASPTLIRQLETTDSIWALFLGLVISLLLAYLTYNRSRYGEKLRRDVARQTQIIGQETQELSSLNRLLMIAMRDTPLAERLQQGLGCILEQDWLGLSARGAVFTCHGEHLEMQAHTNMGETAQMCAQVPSGECLCGQVLQTGKPLLAPHVNADHSRKVHGMQDHGHLILPLHGNNELVGILNLYLRAGSHLDDTELKFVDSAAHILAEMIAHDRTENAMKRLEAAISQTPEGVFITDSKGRIVYANPAAANIWEIPHPQFSGMLAAEVRGGGSRDDALYKEIISRLNRGKSWHGDIECRHKDGSKHIIDRSIAPVMEAGEVRYHVCIDDDVSKERQVAEKMEHTQRLESLGVLAGGIAHDFNNILTTIMGNAALGRMKMKASDPAMAHLASIEEASQHAADLCKQMLAYSGKGRFVVKHLNLSDMVEEITKLLDVSIAKNVVLKFHLAENLPAVEADAAQLQQIIMNLVINASDAIGEKSGVISLSTGMMQADEAYLHGAYTAENIQPGRFVFLEVADTGCGMDEEIQKKVFDPFFSTKFTGRGLGMSAVLGIVQGHHGAIKVYSEPGQGTNFKILLPASQAVADKQAENKAVGEWRGNGTVLVVDDEETICETAAMMLSDMGFDTLTAADGEQGVEVYRRRQDDIVAVLLDMTMPKLDGKGCFRELRRINKDVRVILSSGYNEQDATNRFTGQGLAGFIQKPYTPEALKIKMQEVFRDSSDQKGG